MTTAAALLESARSLSRAERLEILARLWESLDDPARHAPLSDADRALLDRRLAEHRANPRDTIPAAEAERRLQTDKRA